MGDFESAMSLLDYTLDSPRKRHLIGGALLSVSALFMGLALTTMTLRSENEYDRKR